MTNMRRVQKPVSVTQKTYRRLERAIAQNHLVPGQVLIIGNLADELGVSRTPVREALLMLEKVGLVEKAHGRVTVSQISLGDLDDVFEFREALESYCLERLAARGEPRQLTALRDVVAPYRSTDATANAEAAVADLRFHRTLVALSGNARMLAAWDQLATQFQRFWEAGRANLDRINDDLEECLAIVDALEAGDATAAAVLLRTHLRQTKQSLAVWQRMQRSTA